MRPEDQHRAGVVVDARAQADAAEFADEPCVPRRGRRISCGKPVSTSGDEADRQEPVLQALVDVETLQLRASVRVIGEQFPMANSMMLRAPAGSCWPTTISSIFSAVSSSDGPKVKTISSTKMQAMKIFNAAAAAEVQMDGGGADRRRRRRGGRRERGRCRADCAGWSETVRSVWAMHLMTFRGLADVAIEAVGGVVAAQQRGLAVETGEIADRRVGQIEFGADGRVAVTGGAQPDLSCLVGPDALARRRANRTRRVSMASWPSMAGVATTDRARRRCNQVWPRVVTPVRRGRAGIAIGRPSADCPAVDCTRPASACRGRTWPSMSIDSVVREAHLDLIRAGEMAHLAAIHRLFAA